MIRVRNHDIDIDVQEELEYFDWNRKKIEGDEFKACSPFREERNPSFYINLETGLYKDHGAESDVYKQGNLIGLLSFLHNVTYEEIEDYLLEKYNITITDVEGLELKINIQFEDKKKKVFTKEELKPYLCRKKSYLLNRGVSEEIQKKFIIGYDRKSDAVAFFWLDAFTGKVVNVKFRSTKSKQFYYIKGGQPVRNHVFGLYQCIKAGAEKIYIVESEIDALYLWSNGIPAVALGGSHLSDAQKKKLLLAGAEYVIATDADKAGRRIRDSLVKELGGAVPLSEVTFPEYAKDVNEVKQEDIKKVTDSEEPVTLKIRLN
ncbi:toprim domain-containing protein [Priestia megaterium]|uniref:toprim domain-containing protein n=1 Tax=Priestia megaterium TaxID=1404 RepID=UPI0023DA0CF3|nr:toprim domain-containing protein [Priestia megaterium]MDF2010179.1 toprim domain-containing protein [Priestia megaterium]